MGEGLLSPNELVEIHETSAEMEKHRRTLEYIQHQAAMAGEAAVEADRARRAALKEQKKKEAAERKRRHTDAVARRRATDIVFAGRGAWPRLGRREATPRTSPAASRVILLAKSGARQATAAINRAKAE